MRIQREVRKIVVATTLACGAMAASAQGVELYGVADVGVAVTNFDGQTTTAVRENHTARWGLRGAEKLGGGWQAIFRLESEIDMGTGQTSSDGLFSRQAWVGLKSDTLGTMRIGRTKGLFDDLSEFVDPFNNDGIVGDFSKLAWRVGVAKSRVSNSITLEAPKFAGLEVKGQYSMDETPDLSGNPGWSVSAVWGWRDLTLMTAYDRPTLTKAGLQPEAWMVGATYQLGPVKLSAAYNEGDLKNATTTKPANELKGYTLGANWEFGNNVVKGVFSRLNSNFGNVDDKIRDVSVVGLGYDYKMSRRTTLYVLGVYEDTGQYNSTTKKFVTGDTKGVQAGIWHRF